mmetsp:Transcript_105553/g.182462  ORF Transcript_105553/g.182462 Transcript_105553/m.182462 type:complete len:225 (-) Transcript_105553:14-688(-)
MMQCLLLPFLLLLFSRAVLQSLAIRNFTESYQVAIVTHTAKVQTAGANKKQKHKSRMARDAQPYAEKNYTSPVDAETKSNKGESTDDLETFEASAPASANPSAALPADFTADFASAKPAAALPANFTAASASAEPAGALPKSAATAQSKVAHHSSAALVEDQQISGSAQSKSNAESKVTSDGWGGIAMFFGFLVIAMGGAVLCLAPGSNEDRDTFPLNPSVIQS